MFTPTIAYYLWQEIVLTFSWPRSLLNLLNVFIGCCCRSFGRKEWVLYCGNLYAQRTNAFVSTVKSLNGQIIYGPRNKSDCWQPFDVGSIGQLIKNIFRMEQEYWMDLTHIRPDGVEELNWQWWERGLTASERRILVTWWLGAAYEKACSAKYKPTFHRAWSIGGCLAGLHTSHPFVKGHGSVYVSDHLQFEDEAYFDANFSGSPNFVCSDAAKAAPELAVESSSEDDDSSDSNSYALDSSASASD